MAGGKSSSHSREASLPASPRSAELDLDLEHLAASFLRRHRFYAILLFILLCYILYAALYMVDTRAAFGKSRLCFREKQYFERLPAVPIRDREESRRRQVLYERYPKKGKRLREILALPSAFRAEYFRAHPHRLAPVTVVLNFYKRESLCVQLEAIMGQSVQPAEIWVVLFASPLEKRYRKVIAAYHDPRISVVSATYDFKFYGRFQLALEAETKYLWIIDDDMIPGERFLEQALHTIGTAEYRGALGSIGRVLPAPPSAPDKPYASYRNPEEGIYLPDPAYNVTVEHITEVDLLCSMWFLETAWVPLLFREKLLTMETGEDFTLSFMLRKYAQVSSFVLPVVPGDPRTYGDADHRIAFVKAATTKNEVALRDSIWWRHFLRGGSLMRTPLASSSIPFTSDISDAKQVAVNGQQASGQSSVVSCLVLVDGVDQARALTPVIRQWLKQQQQGGHSGSSRARLTLVITGGTRGDCMDLVRVLPLTLGSAYCKGQSRKAQLFDLNLGYDFSARLREVDVYNKVVASLRGVVDSVNPGAILALEREGDEVSRGIARAIKRVAKEKRVTPVIVKQAHHKAVRWVTDLDEQSLRNWNKPKVLVNVITMNRPRSLQRLLQSLTKSVYLEDELRIVINVDQRTDEDTLSMVRNFTWPHGDKLLRVRVRKGGLVETVAGSWFPTSVDEYAVMLEDDIEVSPYWYIWTKYALLKYRYSRAPPPASLVGLSLYTPRLIEVTKPRRRWDSNVELEGYPRSTPFLYQLPCSWGAVYFPEHWVVFREYFSSRLGEDGNGKPREVVPRSRSRYWKTSWKKFMIEEMYLRGFFLLYPNFFNQTSFSTNHLETGEHIGVQSKISHLPEDFTVPLMTDLDMLYEMPDSVLPAYHALPMIDIYTSQVTEQEAVDAGKNRAMDTVTCPKDTRPLASQRWVVECVTVR